MMILLQAIGLSFASALLMVSLMVGAWVLRRASNDRLYSVVVLAAFGMAWAAYWLYRVGQMVLAL